MRAPRPVLLILVYGAFLAVVGAAATAQSILVGAHFNSATLTGLVGSDAATVRAFVNAYVPPADLTSARSLTDAEVGRLEAQLATLPRAGEILRVEIRRADGTIVASTEPGLSGRAVLQNAETRAALTGQAQAAIGAAADAGAGSATFASPTVLRELLPLKVGDDVLGVVGVWRDAVPILARLEDMRRAILLVTVSAGIVAAALLFLVFRSAQARLTRQTEALLDSTRRDPLTDTLNHGALVGLVAQAIERGRADVRPIGIALIDIDNFRLLNDNHGHAAGDEALLAVASTLRTHIDAAIEFGRYGPDEFLLIAPPVAVAQLERVIERLRGALLDLSLRFDETERLPITVSVGIATYPDHASSATGLLASAAGVLEEAKASGGDTVRFAGTERDEATTSPSFDVLQGLVTAIDTKDRYTKRHSEDVARYATFIGRRLGLAPEELHTIEVAGRLHDIGKIGIPDVILRKPGSLTEAEYAIVQQHVALGDMIVRDLPDIEAVRAGIRHHHERWDGKGYLDRLEGERIPRIARILAVADAFSAMTTTRPYRKALDVREALGRLGDAAGTQLDEALVAAFVDGIEHDVNPPLPGEVTGATVIAHPRRVA
ncbi:MAG: HD domain-containing phosphohydrolase [Chloroflexota bacterium]